MFVCFVVGVLVVGCEYEIDEVVLVYVEFKFDLWLVDVCWEEM